MNAERGLRVQVDKYATKKQHKYKKSKATFVNEPKRACTNERTNQIRLMKFMTNWKLGVGEINQLKFPF